ncbi:MAG: hypothetical protein NC078_09070, partial [Ruminococcus sp.]|nr:hypothetical protein [Ruminococcus sp.]
TAAVVTFLGSFCNIFVNSGCFANAKQVSYVGIFLENAILKGSHWAYKGLSAVFGISPRI